jgi:hypothetical protein
MGDDAPAAKTGDTRGPSPPLYAGVLARWARIWSVSDARSVWLGCVLLAAAVPPWLDDPALPRRAAAVLRTRASEDAPSDRRVSVLGSRPVVAPAAEPSRIASHDDSSPSPPRLRVIRTDSALAATAAGIRSGAHTSVAGLLYLVPLIERAGISSLMLRRPELVESGWPVRLIRRVARRLRVDPLDAALLALPRADAALTDSRAERTDTAAALRALRRWCRARARVSIGALVRRPGRVSWSRTHIDVHLPLACADVRVRKAGLDIDPGWVPWLGRVVRFHYDDDDVRDDRAASR